MPENSHTSTPAQERDNQQVGINAPNSTPEVKSCPSTSKVIWKATSGKKIGSLDQTVGGSPMTSSSKGKGPLGNMTNEGTTKSGKSKPKKDEYKLPPLKFSPEKVRYKPRAIGGPSSLRRTALENKVKTTEPISPQRSDIYAWRSSVTVARKKLRVSSRSGKLIGNRSKIPVPSKPETPPPREDQILSVENTPTPTAPANPTSNYSEGGESCLELRASAPPSSPPSVRVSTGTATEYDNQYNFDVHAVIYGENEQISTLRKQFLQALGIDEISLPSLSDYIKNVNFNSVLKDRLREIKIQEMYQRIDIVKTLQYSSVYHGANDKELLCLKEWLENLMDELWMIQCEKMQPSKVWFDQMFRWLWSRNGNPDHFRYDVTTSEELYVLHNAAQLRVLAAKKEHELFNLRDTGVELLRNGFRNKEKKMIEYWSWLRKLDTVPGSCGEDILNVYMRKLTRWDKNELLEISVQRRRMWYL